MARYKYSYSRTCTARLNSEPRAQGLGTSAVCRHGAAPHPSPRLTPRHSSRRPLLLRPLLLRHRHPRRRAAGAAIPRARREAQRRRACPLERNRCVRGAESRAPPNLRARASKSSHSFYVQPACPVSAHMSLRCARNRHLSRPLSCFLSWLLRRPGLNHRGK